MLPRTHVVQVSEKKVLEQKAYMLFYVRDKKSPVPKKSVVVARNDNVIANGIGNKICLNHNQRLMDTAQNGFHVKNVDSLSGAKDQKETLSAEVSRVLSTKDLAAPKVNRAVVSGSSSLGVPETGDGVKQLSVVGASDGPSSISSNPDVPVPDGIRRLDNKGEARCKDSTRLPNGNVSIKELTCSAAILFGSSSVNHDKDSIADKPLNTDLRKQVDCSKADANSPVVKNISNGSLGDSAVEVNNDVGQRKTGTEIVGVMNRPTMTSSTKKESVDKTCLKAKKKSFKSRVTKMHLSFMILYPVLGLRRKKKPKRMKHKIGKRKRSNPSSLDESNVSSDLGPSTSKLSDTLMISSSKHSQRKKSKVGSDKKVFVLDTKTARHNGDVLSNTVDDVRVVNSDTVLANEKQPQKSSRQSADAKETKIVATQKGLLDMLTRGLDSNVARWDDVAVPSLHGVEAQNGNCVTIGYIGDEWDEEYDKGKRKKIRSSKIEFGGPNLFQEMASKKAKVNKARLDRSSSANQPFRIL